MKNIKNFDLKQFFKESGVAGFYFLLWLIGMFLLMVRPIIHLALNVLFWLLLVGVLVFTFIRAEPEHAGLRLGCGVAAFGTFVLVFLYDRLIGYLLGMDAITTY